MNPTRIEKKPPLDPAPARFIVQLKSRVERDDDGQSSVNVFHVAM